MGTTTVQFVVVEGRGAARVHRSTCGRITGKAHTPWTGQDAQPATCCRPQLPEAPTAAPVDYTALSLEELGRLARQEHAAMANARRAGQPLPEHPAKVELERRLDPRAGSRPTGTLSTSVYGTRYRAGQLTDVELDALVRDLLEANPTMGKAAAWRAIRDMGGATASQERVAAAVEARRPASTASAA